MAVVDDRTVDDEELRRQVIRRLRYGLNVVALERNQVPPEGPMDVAITNGLAAIISAENPTLVHDRNGRMFPASKLIDIAEDLDPNYDFDALREVIKITQPLRHARADDEWILPVAHHLSAIVDLDDHHALLVLGYARETAKVDDLLAKLYQEAAAEYHGLAMMSPKDRLFQPDLEQCDECSRWTFLPQGFDDFGGTNAPGHCVACGYERDRETAWELALDAEWDRVKDKW
jgi:hypothetical protein